MLRRRTTLYAIVLGGLIMGNAHAGVRAERLLDAPIISADLHPSIGSNIQGPSLIRVPDWVANPLGRYYLYFADHKGSYIRLAYADALTGPWSVHPPGSLQLADSGFLTEPPPHTAADVEAARDRVRRLGIRLPHDPLEDMITPHIASPDVHVDDANRRLIMYFHGLEGFGRQVTRAALSADGIHFSGRPEILGDSYFRVFRHAGMTYAMAMPGQLYRSADGLSAFEAGPRLFEQNMRHSALLRRGDRLYVFWTRVGDAPESILVSTIDLSAPWREWLPGAPEVLLRPERSWEGADLPAEPSMRSVAYGPVNQLRDPAVFEEGGRSYLLYAVAGESGIGIAELRFDD
ncbi:MAG: hypothetical protein R3E86_16630 [Pseudomonadales bacterium]